MSAWLSEHGGYAMALAMIVAVGCLPASAAAQTCSDNALALQILGSGGPTPSPRASSGYLLWRGGRSVVLIDAGGGVFQRFGQAGGRVADLRLVGVSHLHPDHSSDLPALLWVTQFRTDPLRLVGPSGASSFPPFDAFLDRVMRAPDSAWPILAQNSAPLDGHVVDVSGPEATRVLDEGGLVVLARGVPHGAPTLAFRIDVDEVSLVFGGDQTGADPAFVEFARGADLLLMHLSLSPAADAASPIGQVHATPRAIGGIAEAARARTVVLSHIIVPRADDPAAAVFSGENRETLMASAQAVRQAYAGQIAVAEDLQCIVLRP